MGLRWSSTGLRRPENLLFCSFRNSSASRRPYTAIHKALSFRKPWPGRGPVSGLRWSPPDSADRGICLFVPASRRRYTATYKALSFRSPWPRSGVGTPVEFHRTPQTGESACSSPQAAGATPQHTRRCHSEGLGRGPVLGLRWSPPDSADRRICFFLPVIGCNASQKLSINSKAQRAAPGLNIVPVSPTNLMNALILGAARNECKQPSAGS